MCEGEVNVLEERTEGDRKALSTSLEVHIHRRSGGGMFGGVDQKVRAERVFQGWTTRKQGYRS